MSKIDVKKVFVFGTDSVETIRKKIAYDIKVVPSYIKIINVQPDETIEYSNIIDIAGNYDKEIQYVDFYNETKSWDSLDTIEILKVWLYVNRKNTDPMIMLQVLQTSLGDFLGSNKDAITKLLSLSHSRIERDIKDDINKFLQNYKKEYKNIERFYKVKPVEATNFIIDRSNFQIVLQNSSNLGHVDIFEKIGTSINVPYCKVYNLTEQLKGVDVQSYTKVNKAVLPLDEWINGYNDIEKIQQNMEQSLKVYREGDADLSGAGIDETVIDGGQSGLIMMKLLSVEKYNSNKKLEQYTDVEMIIGRSRLIITMQTITNKGIDQRTSLLRVLTAIGMEDMIDQLDKNVKNVSIAGTYFYPSFELNFDIFSDMVMNDVIFSMYLKIDENLTLQKKKNQIYCYFTDPSGKKDVTVATANITNQITEQRDAVVRTQIDKKYHEQFKPGTKYLRVRITRTNTLDTMQKFMTVFSKLLSLYEINKENVKSFYEKYLGSDVFEEKVLRKAIKTTGKKYLKDEEPELFDPPTSNYSRQCEPKFQPRIADPSELEQLKKDGKEVLVYPKDGAYVGSGMQRNYVCDRPDNIATKHIYPGVKENKPKDTAHKEKYPVIPCCYTKPQNKSKAWVGYYDTNIDDLKKDGPSGSGPSGSGPSGSGGYGSIVFMPDESGQYGRIILGNKFLQMGQLGEIPENIRKLLNSYDDNNKYYRKGITPSGNENSFLDCCLYALDAKYQKMQYSDSKKYVKTFRDELADTSVLETIRQENYENSVDQIRNNIHDHSNYFDPRRYLKLVEDYYKVNIILFSKINQTNGTLGLPNHNMNYLRWNTVYDKTIIVYEHTGSDDVDVLFPHCELMVMISDMGVKNIIYQQNNLYNDLNELQLNVSKSYNLTEKSVPFDLFPGLDGKHSMINIMSQHIDVYGKTRIINIEYSGNALSLLTNPLPNLPVKEVTEKESIYIGPISLVLSLIEYLDGKILGKSCITTSDFEKLCKSLHVELNGVQGPLKITIGIDITQDMVVNKRIAKDKRISEIQDEFVEHHKESQLNQYRYMKNAANWLMEYNFWLFSKYCYANNIILEETELDMNIVEKYISSNTVRIVKHIYINPTQFFSEQSSMTQNGKLIISDEDNNAIDDLVQRLIYSLRLKQRNEPNMIYNSENENSLQYYYKKTSINNYYTSIYDFTQKSDQVIFPSTYAIQVYIKQQQQFIQLFNEIPDQYYSYPYLLQMDMIDNNIVLCHDSTNLQEAYNIGVVWDMHNFNPYERIDKIPLGPFTLITGSTTTDTNHIIKEINQEYDGVFANNLSTRVKIIGYVKRDNTIKYITLLFL